jgi:FkbH-like protein
MIRVLSNINVEPIKSGFRGEAISFAGYNQLERELLDAGSPLYGNDVNEILVFLDGEELLRNCLFQLPDEAAAQSALDEMDTLLSRIGSYLEAKSAAVCTINTIAFPPRTFLSHLNVNTSFSFTALENRINEAIATFAAKHANVLILDWRGLIVEQGYNNLIDDKFWYLARVKLNQTALKALTLEYKRLRHAYRSGPKKVLLLDLDNTLWGGVLGEAGVAGIELGEDGLGKAYREFQQALKSLTEVGVLLAVVSKNNEADALEAFRTHAMMALQIEDFACRRINWEPKPANIIEISRELNVGLDSMVFLDDNPVERELVRLSVPDVAVPEFPADATGLKRWLLSEIVPQYFGKVRLTKEDRDKTRQYRANASRAEAASRMSLEDYLGTLEIRTTISDKPAQHKQRIAQLIQKTNQFNLTARRYSEAEISSMYEDPRWMVLSLEYSDKFGQEGVVAAALVEIADQSANINSLVMSCRVIGRKVEYALLAHIGEELRTRGIHKLTGEYIRTSKNGVAADFYSKAGFVPSSESVFALDLRKALEAIS